MAGTFATWQPEYEERGLPTFPFIASGDRKRPTVRGYSRMGLPTSRQLALKYPDADGLACQAGARNKLTVIDVDARNAEGERLLADTQRQYGPSKFIVRTGNGGFHAYYKHNGENRKIRPDPRRQIDLLGGGPIALPPSRGSRWKYEIIHGTLDDLTALTVLRPSQAPPISPVSPADAVHAAQVGERDAKFWPYIAGWAKQAASFEMLFDHAQEINSMMAVPLPDADVAAKCKYWWDKTIRGENRFGLGQFQMVDHSRVDNLMMSDPDGFLLLTFLQRHHWGREFTLANETCTLMPGGGWRRQRFTAARARLIHAGLLAVVKPASFNPNRPMLCRLVSKVLGK